MKHSIFFKSFWGYLFIILALGLFTTLFSFAAIKTWHHDLMVDRLDQFAKSLAPQVSPLMPPSLPPEEPGPTPSTLNDLVKRIGSDVASRITVLSPNGTVLADSMAAPESMGNHGDRPEVRNALRGGTSDNFRFSTTMNANMLYLATPLRDENGITGVLRVSLFVEDIEKFIGKLRTPILIILAVLIALSALLTYLNARSITRPIRRLTAAAEKISEGDLSVRAFARDRGELGQLSRRFNHMVTEQQRLFDRMSKTQTELQTIISSITEGLVVIDEDGTVRLSNPKFQEISRSTAPEGKKYWEICRSSEFYELIQAALQSKEGTTREIEINGHFFISSVARLAREKSLIITLHEITERKKLEAIKRDFVINVSHELKTPLTSIKGFAETLENEISGEAAHYVSVIKRNTERMINIIQDLLLLSQLEEKTFALHSESVDLRHLIAQVVKFFTPRLKAKNLSLIIDAEEELPAVKGDPHKLEDLFINLIDNAIKYSEPDGGKVTVRLRKEKPWMVCEVEDEGIGIPIAHQDRIFERFYVVDTSRSKETGGTGLGLSIVKHIVLLHHGRIELKSQPGEGTRFTVSLPLHSD